MGQSWPKLALPWSELTENSVAEAFLGRGIYSRNLFGPNPAVKPMLREARAHWAGAMELTEAHAVGDHVPVLELELTEGPLGKAVLVWPKLVWHCPNDGICLLLHLMVALFFVPKGSTVNRRVMPVPELVRHGLKC